MDTIFMNFENSKTSYSHRLLLNLPNKINLRRSDKYVALSNLCYYVIMHEKKKKNHKKVKFKISALT